MGWLDILVRMVGGLRLRLKRSDRRPSGSPVVEGTEVAGLDREILQYERLLAAGALASDRRAALLNNMAIRLRIRARYTGQPSDLDRALRASRAAVSSRNLAAGNGAQYFTTLGNCLIDHYYSRSGSAADLDMAVSAYQQALDEAGDTEDCGVYQANLASALDDRYRRDGDLEDLNTAITVVERISALPDPLEQAGLAANHAGMLLSRYAATGRLDDLDRAVTVTRAAMSRARPGSLTMTTLRINLSGALQSRYDRTRKCADLDEALRQLQVGLTEVSEDAPDRAPLSNNLGIAFAARAQDGAGEQRRLDLDRAIAAHRVAVHSAGRRDRLSYSNDLAGALLDRYQEIGRRHDLRSAVRLWRAVLARTPEDAPTFARRTGNLARVTVMGAAATSGRRAVARARRLYARSFAVGLDADPEAAMASARDWGAWASGRMAWGEAANAYESALVAFERLFSSQLLRPHKEAWLASAVGVAAGAALAQSRVGNLSAAARALERGRALLLSDALEAHRVDLRRLRRQGRADLADKFQTASARLAAANRRLAES
jgi:hypothetical protein